MEKKRIFIIEDDIILLRMLERIFVANNFEVEKALEGADALAKLYILDVMPAAILLDIMIPVLSGVEVLKLLKKSEKLKNVPIIILSNLAPSRESEDSILALGAVAYLHKSQFSPEQVVKKVCKIIEVPLPALPTIT